MSNVINFLERLGGDAKLRNAEHSVLNQALEDAGIDCKLWNSVVAADDKQREKLLGAAGNVCAIIIGVEEDEVPEELPTRSERVMGG